MGVLQKTNQGNIVQTVMNLDAFYPDLKIEDWQEAHRIPGTAPAVLEDQMRFAYREVNNRLETWKAAQVTAGVGTFPAADIEIYQEAIFATATALLIPILPSVITDERAADRAELLKQTPANFTNRADHFIGVITGTKKGRSEVRVAII